MERVKAVRLIPFTPRGRHCRGTAETTMCNMLIDAFDFGRVNDNKKTTLYHAGNIGPEAKVTLASLTNTCAQDNPLESAVHQCMFAAAILAGAQGMAW